MITWSTLLENSVLVGIAGLSLGFLIGFFTGWISKMVVGCPHPPGLNKENYVKSRFIFLVNVIIVFLWATSVFNGIFQFTDAQTPLFLHAMMGAVMGYLNENFGTWLLKFVGKGNSPSKKT